MHLFSISFVSLSLYHMYVYTCSTLSVFPAGDCLLLRLRAAFVAPGRGPLGGLRLLGLVPPAQLPHAVPPAGGRLGRGKSCCGPEGDGPWARGRLPTAFSQRNSQGPVHLQLCFVRAQEVAVRKMPRSGMKRMLLTTKVYVESVEVLASHISVFSSLISLRDHQ